MTVSKDAFTNPRETWDKRFETEDYIFGTEPNAYLKSQQALFVKGGSALVIADGEGRNSVWLAQQGLSVDAFDISPNAVAKAVRLAASAGVQVAYSTSRWEDWDWRSAAYDHVVGIFFQFADPAARQRLFELMARALKPGGLMLIQGYSPKQLEFNTGGPGRLDFLYDESLLRNSFPDFEVLELRTYEEFVVEGPRHQGMSGLIGMVARKH